MLCYAKMLDEIPAHVLVDVLKHLDAVDICRCKLVCRAFTSDRELGSSPAECAAQASLQARHPNVSVKLLPRERWTLLLFTSENICESLSTTISAAHKDIDRGYVGWIFGLDKGGDDDTCVPTAKAVSAASWWRPFVRGYKRALDRFCASGIPPTSYLGRQVAVGKTLGRCGSWNAATELLLRAIREVQLDETHNLAESDPGQAALYGELQVTVSTFLVDKVYSST